MHHTLKKSYEMYCKQCFENSKVSVHVTTFRKFCPADVYLIGKTPRCECVHDKCDNSRYCYDVLKANGLKGFDVSMELDLKHILCEVVSDISLDDKEYGYMKCITRQCDDCRPQLLISEILKENPGLTEDPTIIKWKRWDLDELTKHMDQHMETGTKYQCLKVLGNDMKDLALHLFDMQWKYSQE